VDALWNIASRYGRTSAVVGWWASWPAEEINGWVVSDYIGGHGFGLRSARDKKLPHLTHPASLLQRVDTLSVPPAAIADHEVRRYMHVSDADLRTRSGKKLNFNNPLHHFVHALAGHKSYTNIARYLLHDKRPDLAMFYFEAIDSIEHIFMKFADPPMPGIASVAQRKFKNVVSQMYERQDRALGDLVALTPDDATIIVLSDHGFKIGQARPIEMGQTKVSHAHLWHEPEGILLIAGPGIKPGTRIDAHIYDIAPTVLYALGLPVAQDMPGRVLTNAYDANALTRRPITKVASHEQAHKPDAPATKVEADPALEDRLRALGYLSDTPAMPALHNRMKVLAAQNDVDGVRQTIDEILATGEDPVAALEHLVEIKPQYVDWTYVAELLAEHLLSVPTQQRPGLERARARVALYQNQLPTALTAFRAIAKSSHGTPEDIYHTGLILERLDKLDEALTAYTEVVAKDPSFAFAWNNMGSIADRMGRVDDAQRYFGEAAKADPKHAMSRFNLGILLERSGRRSEAIALYREAAAIAPSVIKPRFRLGQIAFEAGRLARADSLFEQVLRTQPRHLRALVRRARVAKSQGDTGTAQKRLAAAKAINSAAARRIIEHFEDLRN